MKIVRGKRFNISIRLLLSNKKIDRNILLKTVPTTYYSNGKFYKKELN